MHNSTSKLQCEFINLVIEIPMLETMGIHQLAMIVTTI